MAMLDRGWGRMAYADPGGDGFPAVLLHGSGCDAADWREVIAALPPGERAIVVEFRGHGASDAGFAPMTIDDLAADVLALVSHLGLSRVMLVGHSLGGMVAMEAARRDPRVVGLLLMEGWTRLSACAAFSGDRFYGTLAPTVIARIEKKASDTRRRFDPAVWAAFWQTVERYDAFAFLEQATIPIVEAYGALGRVSDAEARLAVPRRPNIELKWIEGAGHYLPHERPVETAGLCVYAAQRSGRGRSVKHGVR